MARYSAEVLRVLQTWRDDATGPRTPQAPLLEAIDVLAGTSAGALCIAGLLVGRSPAELCALLDTHGPKIFPPPTHMRSLRWFYTAKYERGPLEDAVDAALGSAKPKLGDFSQLIAFPAINETHGRAVVLTNSNADHCRIHLRDAVLASAAAPTYFAAHRIPETGERYVDGGLFANAPDLAAITLARQRWPHLGLRDLHVLSIGTTAASAASPHPAKHPGAKGLVTWVTQPPARLLKLSMSCQTDHAMNILPQLQLADFIRIDEHLDAVQGQHFELDNASEEARAALTLAGSRAPGRLAASDQARLRMIIGRQRWRN